MITAESVIFFLANYLIVVMFAGLGLLYLKDGRLKKTIVVKALLASLIAWGLVEMIKDLVPTIRPFLVTGATPLTILYPANSTFPSSHAAVAFALAASLFMESRRYGSVFMLGAFLVGAGRVLAHVHYPLDIAGGAILGVSVALLVRKLTIHFKP